MISLRTIRIMAAYALTLMSFASAASPQDNNAAPPLSAEQQRHLIDSICIRLEKVYIDSVKAVNICHYLKKNLEDGRYSAAAAPKDFADQLDKDIQFVTNDKHMGIIFSPGMAAEMKTLPSGSYYTPAMLDELRRGNYGFKELKILPGNVGYLDLREFCPTHYAGATAVAAMGLLANCDAIIIDLRYNGGGVEDMVQLLLSYFFDASDSIITLSTSYSRYTNSYFQSATFPYVPGKSLHKTPLYVLISKSTFSAAESFAYNLKTLKRAVIVGENTRGGENPVEIQAIGDDYVIYISSWKLLSSIGNGPGRWEGVGIKPELEVDANQALMTAHIAALENLSGKTSDENLKFEYQWAIDAIRARSNRVAVDSVKMKSFVGEYRDKIISLADGVLYFQRGERTRMRMIPIAPDYFLIENADNVRVKFISERGKVTAAQFLYDDGRIVTENKK